MIDYLQTSILEEDYVERFHYYKNFEDEIQTESTFHNLRHKGERNTRDHLRSMINIGQFIHEWDEWCKTSTLNTSWEKRYLQFKWQLEENVCKNFQEYYSVSYLRFLKAFYKFVQKYKMIQNCCIEISYFQKNFPLVRKAVEDDHFWLW